MRDGSPISKQRAALYLALIAAATLAATLLLAEIAARLLESEKRVRGTLENLYDPELGWVPTPGSEGTVETDEYTAHFTINSLGLNDAPVELSPPPAMRILALGDSHTYATGVSVDQTWPNVLERLLFAEPREGAVYNAGVEGYSLGQYLLRMRRLVPRLEPDLVLIGFSMATDLYDLVPPHRGGFVYGPDKGRIYFDLDQGGRLLEIDALKGRRHLDREHTGSATLQTRRWLANLALYRRLKRSALAMWIATRWRPDGQSLWPGMDTALKIELSDDDRYRWSLAEGILTRLKLEAEQSGSRVVLVNIPYLAQVYDEVWEASFETVAEQYDRWIGGRRLAELCARLGIGYIDTTPRLVEEARRIDGWLHHRHDGHPTARGHEVIAETASRVLAEL